MSSIEAIYQDGVFKPLGEVSLPENQRVTVVVAAPAAGHVYSHVARSRRSLADLLGSVSLPDRAPTDDECDQMRYEALKEKYGL